MKTISAIFAVLFFGLFFLTATSSAQIPRTISYQGVLTHPDGNFVADGNYSLTLNLYLSATGGTSIFTEVQSAVVVKGIFNVIIGSVTLLPNALDFNRAYFLGVTIANGTELIPRTALTSVPYALRAERATVAENVSSDAKGVVTTINEVDGPLRIIGAGGTTVNNTGRNITISSVVSGNGTSFKLPYSDSAVNGIKSIFNIFNNGATGTTISGIANKGSQILTMSSAAIWGDGGFGYNGVVGFSNGGSNSFSGMLARGAGNANGITAVALSGDAVNASSSSGHAGFFQSASSAGVNTLEAINTGNGMAVRAISTGSIGVHGETSSPTASGVEAQYSGSGIGTALQITNGAIKLAGTNQAAFVHTATTANLRMVPNPNTWGYDGTEIDNPLCNGDPNAIVLITNYQGVANQAGGLHVAVSSGVVYDTSTQRWLIVNIQTEQMSLGTQFFVLIIKR